jgi:hypothetical protein
MTSAALSADNEVAAKSKPIYHCVVTGVPTFGLIISYKQTFAAIITPPSEEPLPSLHYLKPQGSNPESEDEKKLRLPC